MKPISIACFMLFLLMGIPFSSTGQHIYQNEFQSWFRVYNQTRFTDKAILHLELDERIRLNPWTHFQVFTNSHLHYRLKPWLDFGIGFSYIVTEPSELLTIQESRPWEEASMIKKIGKDALIQFRYRLEERFIHRDNKEDLLLTHEYTWRNRFRLQFSKPIVELGHNKKLTLKLAEEVMINANDDRIFDQNQISASVEFKLTEQLFLENGYVNLFQPISDIVFRDRHVFRTTLHHRIDIRKRS